MLFEGGLKRAFPSGHNADIYKYIYSHVISRNKNYPAKSFNIRNYDLGISDRQGHNQLSSRKDENFPEVQGFLLILDSSGIRSILNYLFVYLLFT